MLIAELPKSWWPCSRLAEWRLSRSAWAKPVLSSSYSQRQNSSWTEPFAISPVFLVALWCAQVRCADAKKDWQSHREAARFRLAWEARGRRRVTGGAGGKE